MHFNHRTIRLPQSHYAKYLNKAIFLGIFAIIITSCTGTSDPALPTLVQFPSETAVSDAPVATQASDTTDSGFVTQELEGTDSATEEAGSGFVTQEVELDSLMTEEAAVTPEVFQPAESTRYQTEDGNLFVLVTSVNTVDNMPTLPEAPAGEKFVVLSTNLANFTGEPILVEASSLTLIDQQFNRYAPVEPEDFLRTPIYGVELNGTNTVLGAVRFAIPSDATPYLLEWCPYNDCDTELLQTLLP